MTITLQIMNIVFCTDNKYVMPSAVLIKSISMNNMDSPICYYAIIDESVTDDNMDNLRREIELYKNHKIIFLRVNGRDYENMPNLDVSEDYAKKNRLTATHTTKACYYRLSMANLLPESVEKVLYFDCDTVVTQNLRELWETDMEGKAVAAVVDEGKLLMSYDQLGYPSSYGYFNSGVMLIDLKYWRDNNMIDTFMQIIKEHAGKMRQHDQEILNIAFYNNNKRLPIKYNFQEKFARCPDLISEFYNLHSQEIEKAKDDIAVIHFTAEKPWYKECGYPLKAIFRSYLKETIWKDYTIGWKNKKYAFGITAHRILIKLGRRRSIYRHPN